MSDHDPLKHTIRTEWFITMKSCYQTERVGLMHPNLTMAPRNNVLATKKCNAQRDIEIRPDFLFDSAKM